MKITRQQIAPNFIQQVQSTCDACAGKGTIVKSKCTACNGKKVKRGTHQLAITVEKGMKDLHEIVFEREGDQHPDITSGDIVFVLRTMPHGVFNRSGNDLYMKQSISLKEALLGFSKPTKHLDGADIQVTRQGITQPGERMVMME